MINKTNEEFLQDFKTILTEKMRCCFAEEAAQMDEKTNFYTLGWDSLDRIEFIMNCEKLYDIEVPNNFIYEVSTFGDVIEGIKKILNNR